MPGAIAKPAPDQTALSVHLYRIFDLTLASTLPLPELPEAPRGPPDLRCCLADSGAPEPEDIAWRHHWSDPAGAVTASIGVRGADYILRFPQTAQFEVSPVQARIRCRPAPGCPAELYRHLLLDQVVPRVLAHRGELVAHAGAALIDGACACFLGTSGAGKSTLVAALGCLGQGALADDGIILRPTEGTTVCIPSYPGARLWDDSLARLLPSQGKPSTDQGWKRRIIPQLPGKSEPRAPLAACFFLDGAASGGELRIEPVAGPEAMMAMIQHSFQFDVTDPRHLAGQFSRLGEVLATRPGLFRLAYPHDYARLPEVCEALVRTLASLRR